ncbi:MAG: AAA family ATPase [Bacteroidales bacterium]|nr:AAA family ATPase [Bacteroidales bacterium]
MPGPDNQQLKLAHDFVQYTDRNIFLTGKAGTGKTTFLRRLREISPKRMIVTAPTGVAAINAGGVTLHSFFQLPFGPHVPETGFNTEDRAQPKAINKFSREKVNIIRSLDLLVIDEISMVRADLLDAVDEVLRRYRNKYKPFGGVQLLMIGDLQQLAPVVKDDDWNLLKPYYDTPFFFSSITLRKTQFISIELKHIYRQSDQEFINLLNKIRENRLDSDAVERLNSRFIPDFDPENDQGYITLTTHNNQAHHINEIQLAKIKDYKQIFKAEISGNFPEYSYPTDQELILKTGAQVMFVKNDSSHDKRFFNGKIGTVRRIEDGIVYVACPGEEDEIDIGPVEWNNYTYSLDEKTNEIIETVIGTFKQVPLKLAWAITIHKSQGLTFDRAIIDANAAFAHGQVYVALSRCRSMEGIVLSSKINPRSIKIDGSILGFTHEIENNEPDERQLSESRQAFERTLISELNDFSSIQRRLDYCVRLSRDNENILEGKPAEIAKEASDILFMDIVDVSRKFSAQLDHLFLQNPDTENNPRLNERISKACLYYSDKVEALFTHYFEKFIIETDNKAVRKSLKDALERLCDETELKSACLEACKSGFSVKTYMEARANASIQKKPERTSKSLVEVSDELLNPELFILIKQWRNEKANELNIPVYLILPQKSILELSTKLPQTPAELKAVKGFGDKKVQRFGAELLEIISDYCGEKNIKSTQLKF